MKDQHCNEFEDCSTMDETMKHRKSEYSSKKSSPQDNFLAFLSINT